MVFHLGFCVFHADSLSLVAKSVIGCDTRPIKNRHFFYFFPFIRLFYGSSCHASVFFNGWNVTLWLQNTASSVPLLYYVFDVLILKGRDLRSESLTG